MQTHWEARCKWAALCTKAGFTEYKKREHFGSFLDDVLADQPQDKEIHVILDNYCTHKKNDDWLSKFEGRVHFHFTPTSANWLNQIEIVFSLLQRRHSAEPASKPKISCGH